MSAIKEHIDKILAEIEQLDKHRTEANEFVAIEQLRIATYDVQKTFKMTKNMEQNSDRK